MKKELILNLLDKIDNNQDIKDLLKVHKDEIKEIVRHFPLLLKANATYKNIEYAKIDIDKLKQIMPKCYNDKTYYTDRFIDANSKTKYPFKTPNIKIKNYISSSILDTEEKIDFIGNAGYSQYYKAIAKLLSNDGNYLNEELQKIKDDFPEFVQNSIHIIEQAYSEIDKSIVNPEKIDGTTTQILFPKDDSYISISPAQSMPLLSKVINTVQAKRQHNQQERKEALKKIKVKQTLLKKLLKEKNEKEISSVQEEIKSLEVEYFMLKTAKWQQMISKAQNISLSAPSKKDGIFLAQTPNYDDDVAKDIFMQNDYSAYITKEIKTLYFKSIRFKNTIDKLLENLEKQIPKEESINKKQKDMQKDLFVKSFKLFLPKIKMQDKKEVAEVFLTTILGFKKLNLDLSAEYKFYKILVSEV